MTNVSGRSRPVILSFAIEPISLKLWFEVIRQSILCKQVSDIDVQYSGNLSKSWKAGLPLVVTIICDSQIAFPHLPGKPDLGTALLIENDFYLVHREVYAKIQISWNWIPAAWTSGIITAIARIYDFKYNIMKEVAPLENWSQFLRKPTFSHIWFWMPNMFASGTF